MPVLLAALLAAALQEAAQPPRHDLEPLLARDVSPGVVALLVPHLGDDRAAVRILSAIAHPDAAVRATAARVCYVYAVRSAVPALRNALASETDRSAAVEMLRAVALLGGTEGREEARVAAERHKATRSFRIATGAGSRPSAPPADPDAPGVDRILVAAALPPGVLKDILAVSRCGAATGLSAIGIVDYRADGRPRHVSVMPQPALSRQCAVAVLPTLSLSLAPVDIVERGLRERGTVVFVPMDRTSLECGDEPEVDRVERADAAETGTIPVPKKVKSVNPVYPARATVMRQQGVVVLEATLSPSGCVRSVVVLKGLSADLDVAALRAVGQWRYSPTLLAGEPVNVIMTVTVNFRLS